MVLESSKIHLLKSDEYFELIFDTGGSKVVPPRLTDFISGYLTNLDEPMAMGGIVGLLFATHNGRVLYEFISEDGGFSIL